MKVFEHPIFQNRVFTHPAYGTFVRLTVVIAVALVALILAAFLLKVVIFAALVAALVGAGIAIYRRFFAPKLPQV